MIKHNKKILLFVVYLFFFFQLYCEKFQIAVIPDTQYYTYHWYQNKYRPSFPINVDEILFHQIKFIADNSIKKNGNIIYAIHLGDSVDHYAEFIDEWESADYAMSILDDIVPFLIVPGNHDYDKSEYPKGKTKGSIISGSSYFNKYFGGNSKHFKNKEWYGGCTDDGLNSYSFFESDNLKFLCIGLEVEPSNKSIEWAQNIINNNIGLPTIIVTHEYIVLETEILSSKNAKFCEHKYRDGFDRNSPKQVFDKLIKSNNQIFLVLCGHVSNGDNGESMRIDINEYGNKVYSLLSDFQTRHNWFKYNNIENYKPFLGDGWMRLMEFDTDKNLIHIKTYSTEFNRYELDENSDFCISIDFDNRFK